MNNLQVATFKSIRDELLANTIESGASIVADYIPGVSEDTLCLPYRKYSLSGGYVENNSSAKGFVINPWSGQSPSPVYTQDLEVLYQDVNFRFKSTFQATNCTISGNSGNTLLLGSSYSATVSVAPGYVLQSVTVTMGGTVVPGYNASTNPNILIDSVLGDIIIIAVAQLITYNIIYNITPTCVESTNTTTTIQHGQNYSTTLQPLTGYQNIGAGNVIVGGTQVDSWGKVASKTISLTDVQGDIEINATCGDLNEYTITFNSNCVNISNPASTILHGERYQATLTPATGYTNIGAGQVTVGDQIVQQWNAGETSVSIDLTATGNIVITVDCGTLETYSITLDAQGCVEMNPVSGTTVQRGSDVTITLTPTTGYSVVGPGRITMNGVEQYSWNVGSSEVELELHNVDGNIVAEAACGSLNTYTLTYKYRDTQNNQIAQDQVTQNINYGTTIDTTQGRITIPHYTFQSQNPDGNVTMTQNTDVIFVYVEDPKYNVTVKYVDSNDNEIEDDDTITGKYAGDQIQSVTIKTIPNYNYDQLSSTSLPFTVTNNPSQNIIYVRYIHDPGSVTLIANYVDDLGGSIPGVLPESYSCTVGTLLTPQRLEALFKKVIAGYEYDSGLPSTTIRMDESKTITLVYIKLVTLTVEYQDENGDPIPNQQSETHVYPRGTELSSSDLAEFIRTIEDYTYDSTIPSSITMSQDLTVIIKYTLNQQCIELDPEFGVQAQLVYEGEDSVEIIYHTLINGVSQEVHESYSIIGETPVKDLNPGEDDVYDTLNSLYGTDFKGYIIGTLNGCDGDVNFKIYVIHCSGACVEVVTQKGCVEWNDSLVYSTDGINGDYRVFILLNGVRQYLRENLFTKTVTNLKKDMQEYNPNTPSDHIYWKKLTIEYDLNTTYGFIPVCEYYIIYTHSDENIYSVYTDTGNQVLTFKKGDNVIVKHQNACSSGSTTYDYVGDVFFTVIPENGSKAWNTNNNVTVITAGPVYEKNAFRHEVNEGYELLKSWDSNIQDFDYSFIDSDKKSKLGITNELFVESTNQSLNRFKSANYDWFYLKQGEFEPILLKRLSESYYNIYPKCILSLKVDSPTSGYTKYFDEEENEIYLPSTVASESIDSIYKCNFLGSKVYAEDTFSVYGCNINGHNYVFPAWSYSNIVRESDLEKAYMSDLTTYGIGRSSNTACYVANKNSYDTIERKYIFNSYIIPHGLTLDDFLPESGESETIIVYKSMDNGDEIELSKNKLDTYAIRNLGSDIEVYVEIDPLDKCNNYLCHEITNLNGDIYLWNGSSQTLPVYCVTYYYDKDGSIKTYILRNTNSLNLSWNYYDETEEKTYECTTRVRCENDESNPANCSCSQICSSEVTVTFVDCNGTPLGEPQTGTAYSGYPVRFTYDEDNKHGGISVYADCERPQITENVYVETWIKCMSPDDNDTFTVHFKDDNGNVIWTETFPVTNTYYTVDKCGTETYPSKSERVRLPSNLENNYYINQDSTYWNLTTVSISCNVLEVDVIIYEKCQYGSLPTYYLGDVSNNYVLGSSSDPNYDYETTIIASSYDDVQIPTSLLKTFLTELCTTESIPITASYETEKISTAVWKLTVTSSEFNPNTVTIKVNVSLS